MMNWKADALEYLHLRWHVDLPAAELRVGRIGSLQLALPELALLLLVKALRGGELALLGHA